MRQLYDHLRIFRYMSGLQILIFYVWNFFKMSAVAAIFRKFSEKLIFAVIILQLKLVIWNTWNFCCCKDKACLKCVNLWNVNKCWKLVTILYDLKKSKMFFVFFLLWATEKLFKQFVYIDFRGSRTRVNYNLQNKWSLSFLCSVVYSHLFHMKLNIPKDIWEYYEKAENLRAVFSSFELPNSNFG